MVYLSDRYQLQSRCRPFMAKLLKALALLTLVGCGAQSKDEQDSPIAISYASYEDCILGKLGRGQSTVASKAIIDACWNKYGEWRDAPRIEPAAKTSADPAPRFSGSPLGGPQPRNPYMALVPAQSDTSAPTVGRGMFDDLIPATAKVNEPPGLWDDFDAAHSNSAKSLHGYNCTGDCSGHEAGYQWAEDSGIEDPEDCGGNSQSFIEGCQAWAEENG